MAMLPVNVPVYDGEEHVPSFLLTNNFRESEQHGRPRLQFAITANGNFTHVHVDGGQYKTLIWEDANFVFYGSTGITKENAHNILSLTLKSDSALASRYNSAVQLFNLNQANLLRGLAGGRVTEEILGVYDRLPIKWMMSWYGHCLREEANPMSQEEAAACVRQFFRPASFDEFYRSIGDFCTQLRDVAGNLPRILAGLSIEGVEAGMVMSHFETDTSGGGGIKCVQIDGGRVTRVDLPGDDPFEVCMRSMALRIFCFGNSSIFFLARNSAFIGFSKNRLEEFLSMNA